MALVRTPAYCAKSGLLNISLITSRSARTNALQRNLLMHEQFASTQSAHARSCGTQVDQKAVVPAGWLNLAIALDKAMATTSRATLPDLLHAFIGRECLAKYMRALGLPTEVKCVITRPLE